MHSEEYHRFREQFLDTYIPKNSVCAELGVHLGHFSKTIIDYAKPKKIHLIDPWIYFEDDIYDKAIYGPNKGENQDAMDIRFKSVRERFKNEIEKGQVVIHRNFSYYIFDDFEDEYFDWIYIDSNHLYDYVKMDLALYYNKVKKGGFISGDDYVEGGWWNGGVKKAVDEFIKRTKIQTILFEKEQYLLKK